MPDQNTVKKAVTSATNYLSPTLISWGTFFATSGNTNKAAKNDEGLNQNNIPETEEDEEGYIIVNAHKLERRMI